MFCFLFEELSHEVVHCECGLYHTSLLSEKSAVPVSPAQENQVNPSLLNYEYIAESHVLSAAMEMIAHESHLSSAILVSYCTVI